MSTEYRYDKLAVYEYNEYYFELILSEANANPAGNTNQFNLEYNIAIINPRGCRKLITKRGMEIYDMPIKTYLHQNDYFINQIKDMLKELKDKYL